MLDPESLDPEDESIRARKRQVAWLEVIGFSAPDYEDEGAVPPITEEEVARLRAYVRNELPREHCRRITALVRRFRSWADAELAAGAERRGRGGGPPVTEEALRSLRAYARKEVVRAEVLPLLDLTLRYRAWAEALLMSHVGLRGEG